MVHLSTVSVTISNISKLTAIFNLCFSSSAFVAEMDVRHMLTFEYRRAVFLTVRHFIKGEKIEPGVQTKEKTNERTDEQTNRRTDERRPRPCPRRKDGGREQERGRSFRATSYGPKHGQRHTRFSAAQKTDIKFQR